MPVAPAGDAVELLAALARAFAERRRRWYVFGAQAVVAHGRPRLTADVDATVELVDETPAELAARLEAHGFVLRFPLASDRTEPPRLLPMVHTPSAMPLDLVIAAPGLDEEFLARAVHIDLGGVEIPVLSAEDLVGMKILAGRRKDLEDVRGVLVEKGAALDLARVRDLVRVFQEASGDTRLLRRLDRQLRAARKRAR